MRKTVIAAMTLAVLAVGCDRVSGSGVAADDDREVPAFERVRVAAGLRADVAPGAASVVVHGDDNIVAGIETIVVDGELRIRPLHDVDPVVPLWIEVRTPVLEAVALRAGGEVIVHDVAQPSLALEVRSGGLLRASGEVEHVDLFLASGGTLDASAVEARSAVLHARAGGQIIATATESVDGLVESGSRARVHGAPAARTVVTESGGQVGYE